MVIVTIDDHEMALDFTEDKQRIHHKKEMGEKFLGRKAKILQGVHIIGLIESQPPIKDQYLLKLDKIVFGNTPVGIVDKVNLDYKITFMRGEPASYMYKVEVTEDGREVMTCIAHTTDNYDVYRDIMNRTKNFKNIFKIDTNKERTWMTEINLNKDWREYCKIMHINEGDYLKKYNERDSGMSISLRTPGSIVNKIGDLEKFTYIFKKYTTEMYFKDSDSKKIQILGNKREKGKFSMLDFILKDYSGSILGGSEASAFAI